MSANLTDESWKKHHTPCGVPDRFSSSGVVQYWPGITTVCHFPPGSPIPKISQSVQEALKSNPKLSSAFTLLPESSWHMTTLDFVVNSDRSVGQWPAGKEDWGLEELMGHFKDRVREVGRELEKEGLGPPYRLRVRGFDPCTDGIGLLLDAVTVEEEKRLRRLRDKLADEAFGFRKPNHESYVFHSAIAYLLRTLDDDERAELNKLLAQISPEMKVEFELGAVEFCSFENLHRFDRVFYLGE